MGARKVNGVDRVALMCVLLIIADFAAMAKPPLKSGVALRELPPHEVRVAAERGFQFFVSGVKGKTPKSGQLPAEFPIAVSSYAELEQATIGLGFEEHTVDPKVLVGARNNEDLGAMTKGTGRWNFFVMSNGRPTALIEVGNSKGAWRVIGIGSSGLAVDMQEAVRRHARGGEFKFVRIFQATSDFLQVRGLDGGSRYVPLLAARATLGLPKVTSNEKLHESRDVLPALKKAVLAAIVRTSR